LEADREARQQRAQTSNELKRRTSSVDLLRPLPQKEPAHSFTAGANQHFWLVVAFPLALTIPSSTPARVAPPLETRPPSLSALVPRWPVSPAPMARVPGPVGFCHVQNKTLEIVCVSLINL